jgi:large subunit ribosomal protein L7/L12
MAVEQQVSEKEKEKVEEPKAVKAKKEESPAVSKKLQDFLGQIEKMTVLELSEFVKALEEKFGVTAAAPVAVAAAGASGAGGGEAAEEKDSFTIVLSKAGDKKIQVIKEIRTMTSLGLKEAKDLVDSCPKPVREGVPKKEAEELKKKLEAAGAAVELK